MPYSLAQVKESGQPAYCFEVDQEAGHANGRARQRKLQELGVKSLLIVPVLGPEQAIGIITLVGANFDHRRSFGPADLALAEEFARRVAMKIELGRLQLSTLETR